MKKYAKVKSLEKAMKVLEVFTIEHPELSVTEISSRLGLYKSNTYNILSTLEELGYITQNQENSKYRLGIKILNLGYIFNAHMSIQRIILPYMQRIADETRENVYLAVPDEDEVVYLESCSPYGVVPTRSLQGERAPMYCTAIGKAMLAYLPARTLKKVYEHKQLVRFTVNTIVDRVSLEQDLETIRGRGYSIDNMEHEFGIKCVGVPIRKRGGEVYAALSISGPSLRMSDDAIVQYAALLRSSIREIEESYQF